MVYITIDLMSFKRTETVALDDPEAWGCLVPLPNTQPLPIYSLTKDEVVLGRSPDCTISINDKRLSGKHCTISRKDGSTFITDLSTNGTFIGPNKIGKGKTVQLNHLDEVWLLTASKVPIGETICLRFEHE